MAGVTEQFEQNSKQYPGELVNDVHSRLNPTIVKKKIAVTSCQEIIELIQTAHNNSDRICIAGDAMLWVGSSSSHLDC